MVVYIQSDGKRSWSEPPQQPLLVKSGSRFVERMLTVTTTLKQQRRQVLPYLVEALRAGMGSASAPGVTELPLATDDPRPRERLCALGPAALVDGELLDLILGTSGQGALAQRLLQRFGGLHGLERARSTELVRIPGMGPARVASLRAALALGRRLAVGERPRGDALRSADDAFARLSPLLRHLEQETFVGIYLDARHRVLARVQIARGGLTACAIHPREVLVPAVREAAAALIVAHNHPSGDPAPSADDIALTSRLMVAAEALGVRLLDHLVIGDGRYVSLAEEGLIPGVAS